MCLGTNFSKICVFNSDIYCYVYTVAQMDTMTQLGALLEDHKKTKSPFIKMLADGIKAGDLVVLAAIQHFKLPTLDL